MISNFISRITENFEILLAIVLGMVATFIGIAGADIMKPSEVMVGLTATSLALVAFGMIKDRSISKETLIQLTLLSPTHPQLAIRDSFSDEIRGVINSADELIICQMRTGRILRDLQSYFEDALNRGCKLEIIACSINDSLVNTISTARNSAASEETVRRDQETCRQVIRELQLNYEKQISFREINYVPSKLKYISDPAKTRGKCFVIPIAYKANSRNAPSVYIERQNQEEIFDFYVKEFYRMWEIS